MIDLVLNPFFPSDVIKETTAATIAAKVKKNSDVTLLQQIRANEKATHEDNAESLIQTINYQGCHKRELIETLFQMQGTDDEDKKYPLIYLVRDFEIFRGRQIGVYGEGNFNIIIAHHTQSTDKITAREAKVFRPVLYPIYYMFMRQLAKHSMLLEGNDSMMQHTLIERSYWGRTAIGGNDQNKLNDYVDALEITNLKLKFNFLHC